MRIKKIGNDYLEFDNGLLMTSDHWTECCESHWADFSVMSGYNLNTTTGREINIYNVEFDENIKENIQLIKDEGFNLIAKDGSKYFIPCYAENNGYYGSDLTLCITIDGVNEEIDISECQQW